ncbi:MAG: glycosyltransferase family 4 protein [Ignavibacterium sp.]
MKKILIVNQNAGYLTIDVANAFCREYDQVVLFCGRLRVYDRRLNENVKAVKTIPYNKASILARIFTWGICTLHLLFLMITKFRGYNVLYYTNPPTSYFISLLTKHLFAIVVFDIYPDNLKIIGIKENNFLFKVYKKINQLIFARAEKIITLSDGMATILRNYVNEDKIKVVPLWAAYSRIEKHLKVINPIEVKYKLENKFIILYAGTMGRANNLEIIFHAAKEFNNTDIIFVFAGDGEKKQKFIEFAHSFNLTNVLFLSRQSPDDTVHLFNLANLAVIALDPQASLTAVPSKTYNYLAFGLPILSICESQSEINQLIEKHHIGFSVRGDDTTGLVNIIQSVYNDQDQLKKLSANCLAAAKIYDFHKANDYLF